MSVPALSEPSPGGVVLYSLPEYEPSHEPGAPGPPRRWSSLRPVRGPQLALAAPPDEPTPPAPGILWRLVMHVLEVLDGRRTVNQLRTILSDPAYEALLTRLRTGAPGNQHRLRWIRACNPAEGVVELCAVIEVGGPDRARVRAAAMRVEKVDDRWHCAVLRIL